MWNFGLVFVGSFLASAHCVGMCGGFALILGLNSQSWRQNLSRQMLYSAGRILTYSLLGLIVGILGTILIDRGSALLPWQALLAIIAGLLLVWQSLHALGLKLSLRLKSTHDRSITPISLHNPSLACRAARNFRALLTGPDWLNVFLAGILTGFLPCGLVYSFLALAASCNNAGEAWLTMTIFGIGTVPLMVLTGVGSGLLSFTARQKIWRLAAICVLVTGLVSISRGISAWHASQNPNAAPNAVCPCCEN
jgi:sulfite exporter TauE/SafE